MSSMYGKDTSSLVSVALLVFNASSDEPSRRDVVVILFSSSLKALAFLTRGRETKSFRALSK
jgi:hypothetical protein